MTIRSLLLVFTLGVAATAAAQAPAPAATPARDAPAPAPSMVSDGPPSRQDPRVCLEFPTREQIIACAEKFRPRRPAAKA